MHRCPICGNELEQSRCPSCRGYRCHVCGHPVYRDESFAFTARGKRHARCMHAARPRPEWMMPVVSSRKA
jgi:hypothetical protein